MISTRALPFVPSRTIASTLAIALTVPTVWSTRPLAAVAAPAEQPAQGDDIKEVKRLYDEGRARYETLDYDGAIELWTKAYAQVPATDDNREIRNNLVYNIASAQEKAFELDSDVTHLRRAKGLLERYLADYKVMYKPTPEAQAEARGVEQRIAELDARIAQATGTTTPVAATPPPAATPAQTAQMAERNRRAQVRDLLRNDPEIAPMYSSGKGMVIGGSVMLGVGSVLALFGAIYGFPRYYWNEDIYVESEERTRRRRIGGITTFAVGMGSIAGGAVLVALGSKRRREAKRRAEQRVGFVPMFDGRFGGVQLTGRF